MAAPFMFLRPVAAQMEPASSKEKFTGHWAKIDP
jgi:hypothetical protein